MCLRDLLVVVVRKLRRMMGRNRNLKELWKAVGTEWNQLDEVNEFNWDFKNLEEALEEGGILYGKKFFVFCIVETQFLVPYKDAKNKIVHVPTLVAIELPFISSDKLGVTLIMRSENIVPMKQMKMDWIPYEKRIYVLGCTETRAALKHIKGLEFILPYFYQPFKEDELEHSTMVEIVFPSESPVVVCEFDWEFDELEEFVDKLIQEEAISAKQNDEFKEFVEERVRAAMKADREAKDARKKAIEEMSEDTKQAFQSMKFYKFYPQLSPNVPRFEIVVH